MVPVSASRCAGREGGGGAGAGSNLGGKSPGQRGRGGGCTAVPSQILHPSKSVNAGLSCAAATPKPQHYDRTITPPLRAPPPHGPHHHYLSPAPQAPKSPAHCSQELSRWLKTSVDEMIFAPRRKITAKSGPIRGGAWMCLGWILFINARKATVGLFSRCVYNCIDLIKTKDVSKTLLQF